MFAKWTEQKIWFVTRMKGNTDYHVTKAPQFRISDNRRQEIVSRIIKAVNNWPKVAEKFRISRCEKERMESAFSEMKTK